MKKIVLSIILLICSIYVIAQCKYKIDFSAATFPPAITNGDTLFNGASWRNGNRQEIQLPFAFKFFDASFQSVFYETTGRLVFDANHFYFVDAISCIGFADEGAGTSKTLSPVIVTVDSVGGEKKVRIRAQNVRLRNAPTKSVNFEIQLHENNTIHCFVGNHSPINTDTEINFGPYMGVYNLESISPAVKFKNSQNVVGTTNNPRDTCFDGEIADYLSFELKDFPNSGTKISITPLIPTSVNLPNLQPVSIIYKNSTLHITSYKELSRQADIINISTGQQNKIKIENGKADCKLQPNTYYLLKIEGFTPLKFYITD